VSTISILVDGVEQVADVMFAQSSFSTSFNATPGDFNIMIRDPNRNKSFSTGKEISCVIDGITMFGGYVTQVSMVHLAPAADTANLSTYNLRAWNLRGTDYNIIFDRRVWRNTADYLSFINLSADVTDGAILRDAIDNYSDCSDFDSSGIEDIASIPTGDVLQQGDKLRKEFENLSLFGGAVWYINGAKVFIYTPFETVTKSWGFSDAPVGPTQIGFRQVEATEDGSYIVNDALVWGGSEFAGSGGTVFSRSEDATSQSTYGRWQIGETHFGELGYKLQAGVDARSDVIINGPPGADVYGQQKGLRYSQWQFTFTWFSQDVPSNDHLVAGDIVEIDMTVFGVDKLLPLRTLRISFPDAFENDGSHLVQFDGTFGLQLSDPFTLWAYLLKQQTRLSTLQAQPGAVTDTSTSAAYGAQYQGTPDPATDNATVVFNIQFGYVPGSLQVYLGVVGTPGAGLLVSGTDFTETDPDTGEFTMATAPTTSQFLYCLSICVAS
jgi:hypothetical protein